MPKIVAALLAALCAVLVAACGGSASQEPPSAVGDRLPVVATFSILGDVVAAVGGDRVAVTTLVGPDGDAHVYEPTPQDAAAVADAAIVFENGLGFETWLEELVDGSGTRATRVVTTEGIEPGVLVEDGVEEQDPHVWQDVRNEIVVVERVRDALVAADPAGGGTYEANAAAYVDELEALDEEIAARVDELPAERRKLVTTHDAFGYFARRYGFEIVGTALPVSTEAADPAAGDVAALVDRIAAAGVPAIFAENIENQALLERIAGDAGVVLGPDLYSDALGPAGSAGATYVGMMRANADAIVGALAR